ncbi:hypothetical protein G9A89_004150 [Geosiphon pyriformis]|nr:hypothetical protein G9A89_004150 [Geosiphon pyriformis]
MSYPKKFQAPKGVLPITTPMNPFKFGTNEIPFSQSGIGYGVANEYAGKTPLKLRNISQGVSFGTAKNFSGVAVAPLNMGIEYGSGKVVNSAGFDKIVYN